MAFRFNEERMEEELESTTIVSRQEGYDYEFVNNLDQKYECAICLLALRNPQQTFCGHRFCKDCILNCILNGNSLCPVDNNPLSLNEIFHDTCIEREILDLMVLCPSHNHGCKRTVCLRDLPAHLQACQYQVVLCPNHCASTVLAGELQQHLLETCILRATRCNLCGEVYPFDKEQLHRAMCGDVEVQCDACGDLCKRSNITTHLTTSCPDTLTCCPYAEFGCSDKCRRADMEQHVRNSTQLHLQLVSLSYKKMSTFVSELSRTVGMIQSPSFSRQPSLRSQLSASSPTLVEQVWEEETECEEDKKRVVRKLDVKKKEEIAAEVEQHQMQLSSLCNNKVASSEKVLRELCDKVVDLDQRVLEEAIKHDNIKKEVEDIAYKLEGISGRICNGDFLWRITNFSLRIADLEVKNQSLYSPPFYTSFNGYKCCLRIHVNLRDDQKYLSLYFRMMRGVNDDILDWPFNGSITMGVLDNSSNVPKKHIVDHLKSDASLQAFRKPSSNSSEKSFGITRFVLLNTLLKSKSSEQSKSSELLKSKSSEGLYLVDDVLCVRAKVVPFDAFSSPDEAQFVRNGSIASIGK